MRYLIHVLSLDRTIRSRGYFPVFPCPRLCETKYSKHGVDRLSFLETGCWAVQKGTLCIRRNDFEAFEGTQWLLLAFHLFNFKDASDPIDCLAGRASTCSSHTWGLQEACIWLTIWQIFQCHTGGLRQASRAGHAAALEAGGQQRAEPRTKISMAITLRGTPRPIKSISFQHVVCRKLRRTNIILNRFKMIQELQYLHETAFYINLFTCKVAVARSEACKRPKQWLLGIVSESESCRISNELLAETCLI